MTGVRGSSVEQIILLLVLLFATLACAQETGDFRVEPLTPVEVETMQKANDEFAKAQAKYNQTVSDIEQAHGATPHYGTYCGPQRNVQIRGKYALITTTQPSCAGFVLDGGRP